MEKELKPGRFLKTRIIKEYADKLKDSSSLFVTDFKGLTNKQIEELRKKLKAVSSKYLVINNSLCKSALKDLKLETLADLVDGSCAISYTSGDPVAISKALVNFAKNNEHFQVKGGYIDGNAITVDIIKELAAMPSREILLGRLTAAINSPITGMVSVCSGIIKKILYAINDIARKKEEKQ
jgi:large subunit ribosomal protein L10